MEDKIRAAFAELHADEALIDDTLAYLRKEAKKRQNGSKKFSLPMRLGAVAAMILLIVGLFSYNLYFTAVAHVSIDVNPSVELTLNRFDKVIDTYAFNEDGTNILNEAGLRGKTYSEAAALLLMAIEANGYIVEDTLISVTVQATSNEREQTLCESLLQFISEKILPVQASAEIEVFPVTAEVWSNAHGCHVSPARFLEIQELMDVDDTATIEDYADTSIRQIRRRTQECRDGHTESNDSNSESDPQNEQGHWQGNGHGHGYRGGR